MREIYFDFYLNILPFQPNQKLPEYSIIYAMHHILKQQLIRCLLWTRPWARHQEYKDECDKTPFLCRPGGVTDKDFDVMSQSNLEF